MTRLLHIAGVFFVLCAYSAHAQIDIQQPGFITTDIASGMPLEHISGMALHEDGSIYVSDLGVSSNARILEVKSDGTVVDQTPIGLTLVSPGRMAFGWEGHRYDENTMILADWNVTPTSTCCNGRVLKLQRDGSGELALDRALHEGSPYREKGDPFGVALSDSPYFLDDIYIMDFQGASDEPPLLFGMSESNSAVITTSFAEDAGLWTKNQSPSAMAFGPGGVFFGDGLYVVDRSPANPEIWRVGADGNISAFTSGAGVALGAPVALSFARGGLFGSNLYVLDAAGKRILVIDPDGDVSVFATRVPATIFSDMAFSPNGESLYLGTGNRIVEITSDSQYCPSET